MAPATAGHAHPEILAHFTKKYIISLYLAKTKICKHFLYLP